MRKVATLILVILFSVTVISANAAEPRTASVIPGLSFSAGQANCTAHVSSGYSTDSIRIVAQLSRGNTVVATWTDKGTGYLYFNESTAVSQKGTYTLTITVTINNTAQSPVSITKTY